MRITGGQWASRRLKGPRRTMPLRPTPDAMRERAFAVLGQRVHGARVLDLYAGTGAVALEALSRGAVSAVLVDSQRAAARLIEDNRATLGLEPAQARVLLRPVRAALQVLARRGAVFELVWADPPFASWRDGLEALTEAVELGLAAADATLCLECPSRADLDDLGAALELERDLCGGASRVAILTPARAGGSGGRGASGPSE